MRRFRTRYGQSLTGDIGAKISPASAQDILEPRQHLFQLLARVVADDDDLISPDERACSDVTADGGAASGVDRTIGHDASQNAKNRLQTLLKAPPDSPRRYRGHGDSEDVSQEIYVFYLCY